MAIDIAAITAAVTKDSDSKPVAEVRSASSAKVKSGSSKVLNRELSIKPQARK